MKPDEQRMRDVLVDTIRLLCRTGIDYSRRLRVQGLLGITVDDEHVFLIHVDDFIARNCTEVDTSVCGFVDDCGGAGRARVNSDVVGGASTGSVDHHNVPEDIRDNCTNQCQSTSAVQQPKQTLSQSTHTDVLTSVAMSEISAAVAATAETRDFPSSQMLSHNAQNVPLYENISPPVAAENCSESQSAHFTSNGNTTAPESCASPSVPQTSVPNEVTSNDRSEIPIPVFVRMEMDGRVDGKSAENVVVTLRDDLRRSDVAMCATDVGSENRCMLSNLDDVDSCTDDGDSDRTSESDDVPDHLALPPLELISSLQYQPQALVGNASRWQIGGVQQPCGSDTGTDPVTIQPAVLTGVSGSHASAYYQQQVDFMFKSHFTFNIFIFDSSFIIKWLNLLVHTLVHGISYLSPFSDPH